jgi:hypothetical protein
MNKGVANFWRYAQVARQAHARYLEALAQAQPKGKAIAELDCLCQPRRVDGKQMPASTLSAPTIVRCLPPSWMENMP